ncbi:MAG: AraC family transcriptional regulator [Planctomycetaceae bacterium]|nr:AraC family transcriptional regulator [Planctomycetaceae bacterium]
MSKTPRFHDGVNIYSADACAPLSEALAQGDVVFKGYARGQYPGTPLVDGVLPGLRTVGCWNASREQTWGLDWHRNEGIEICFLLNGSLDFWTGSSFWRINAGHLTACRPWQLHRIGNPHVGASTLLWFILDLNIRSDNQACRWPDWIILSRRELEEFHTLLLCSDTSVFNVPSRMTGPWEKLYRLLRDSSDNPEHCPVSAIAISINEILYDLLQLFRDTSAGHATFTKDQASTVKIVQRFLEELEAIPTQLEHPWTVREMAKLCRISTTRFSRCCYQLTNLSPVHALNQMRIRRAEKMMLEQPEMSITQIAMNCGFTTSQYFATVFRKWTGKTPSEYRQSICGRGD